MKWKVSNSVRKNTNLPTGEILTAGSVSSIRIRRNTLGEKRVEKGEDILLTIERFRELQTLESEKLKSLPTHEKVIWLRWMIDSNTPVVTQGSNDLVVNRDNLIADAMHQFNEMSFPRRVSASQI